MLDILVFDDAFDKKIVDSLEKLLLGNEFPWFFNLQSVYGEFPYDPSIHPKIPNNCKESYQFTHSFFDSNQGASVMFEKIQQLLIKFPVKVDSVFRIKANLKTYVKEMEDSFCLPHVDFSDVKNLITAIYYVNDATGDTIIYNEKIGNIGDLTAKQTISPKKGRLIVFDGAYYHAGNSPKDDNPRVIINFNFGIND